MKLWIWSDLHGELEYVDYPDSTQMPDCDVIVIAGDLQRVPDMMREAEGLINLYQKPIIFVPGNHEFYQLRGYRSELSRSFEGDLRKLKFIEKQSEGWSHKFHVLDRNQIVIDGVRFIGAILWVDFLLGLRDEQGLEQRLESANYMLNDFRAIRMESGEVFNSRDMLRLHEEDAQFIRETLNEPFDGKTVVVTHHMPHEECTPEIYIGSDGNFLFACSKYVFEDVLNGPNIPDLWICGHTHYAFDKTIGQTRVICNPRGYWHEQGKNEFSWNCMVAL